MAQQNAASATVTVGCKLPHGIVLRRFKPTTRYEPVLGGGSREVTVYEQFGEPVTVLGNAHPQISAPRGPIAFGYALTPGVPREVWEDWHAANENSDMVRNGLIFAHGETRSVEAQAKEKEKVRTGMERLDPNDLPLEFKNKRFKIEKAKE